MADLLSSAQHAQIRAALQGVFDTFCDTKVTLIRSDVKLDDFMEDFDQGESIKVEFNAFVEYMSNDSDKADTFTEGKVDDAEVKVLIGLDDLETLGLITDNNLPAIVVEQDTMEINGEVFNIIYAAPSGAFEAKNVAVLIFGKKDEQQT